MELIAKQTNSGKTTEAIEIAATLEGHTLFVCVDESSEVIASHLNAHKLAGKVVCTQLHTSKSVINAMYGYAAQGIIFENIILDTSRGISHADWFKLAVDLEADGFYVVTTQQLCRTDVKSKETLTIRQA
jgi:hypothetical protein